MRVSSYVFNIINVTGALLVPLAPYPDGSGRSTCSSKFDAYAIYQEHITALLFEFFLVFLLARVFYIRKMEFSAYIKQFLDFEVISFGIYLGVEFIYLVCYSIFPKSWVSIMNTLYLPVPVLLFSLNIFAGLKRERLKTNTGGGVSSAKRVTRKELFGTSKFTKESEIVASPEPELPNLQDS